MFSTGIVFRMCVAIIAITVGGIDGLDNGLALTPPMGWMAWQRFRCVTDCQSYPDDCISEKLFMKAADLLVSEGYAKLGYQYVIVDDCWLAQNRSADGKLQADKNRFPNGIKALSKYVHSKGLKFGLYEDWGSKTCAGYPGVWGHEELDAQTFAEWGVDYVKLDGCYSDVRRMDKGYPDFGKLLNKTGRPMVYSCSWPAYQEEKGMLIDYASMAVHCNLWRNYDDIDDSWESMIKIADYFAQKQEFWTKYAGPGHWNDPDMLLIGNYGLTYDQSKVQMAIWTVLAAPLLMSNKLTEVRPEFKEILQNKEVIKISQDTLGIQGTRVFREKGIDIWARPILPVYKGLYSYALAFVSRRVDGTPFPYNITLQDLGLNNTEGYKIINLFGSHKNPSCYFTPKASVKVRVPPSGVVFLRINVETSIKPYDDNSSKSCIFT